MFTLDATIDAVQNGKKQFVTTFVPHKAVAGALIDSQTEYTKQAVKSGTDTFTKISQEVVKAAQETAKFDFAKEAGKVSEQFTKIGQQFMDSVQSLAKTK